MIWSRALVELIEINPRTSYQFGDLYEIGGRH